MLFFFVLVWVLGVMVARSGKGTGSAEEWTE